MTSSRNNSKRLNEELEALNTQARELEQTIARNVADNWKRDDDSCR